MSRDLRDVPTTALARELIARSPSFVRARVFGGRFAARTASAPIFDRTTFGTFARDDGTEVELWAGYRDRVKSRWRAFAWPLVTLNQLAAAGPLPPRLAGMHAELLRARTLPFRLEDLERELNEHVDVFGDRVRVGKTDESTGTRVVTVSPTNEQAGTRAHEATARSVLRTLRAYGVEPREAAVLEVGCGAGLVPTALAAAGVRRAIGIDLMFDGDNPALAAARTRAPRAGHGEPELITGDAHELPFADATLDAAFSFSTLEHILDPPRLFAELARVLRPGGITYHVVDPWFGPQGGHVLCTLDFPWGHARLTPPEFERYIREWRPYEADNALSTYAAVFPTPRLASDELEETAVRAGFDLLSSSFTTSRFPDHAGFLDADVLGDLRRASQRFTMRELVADAHSFVARRR